METKRALYNFATASDLDSIVHGASRPGVGCVQAIPAQSVDPWIGFMRQAGIRRVLVLLAQDQLNYYKESLLDQYRTQFSHVTWAPIQDFGLPELQSMQSAMDALWQAEAASEKIVVHCAAGMGRTGIVLASWLILRHGLSPDAAVAKVVQHAQEQGATRVPSEAHGAMQYLKELVDTARCLATTKCPSPECEGPSKKSRGWGDGVY